MKRLFLLALLLNSYQICFAANGANLIGSGPVSRGMGGIGTAFHTGVLGAVTKNPAALSVADKSYFAVSGSFFSMSLQADGGATGGSAGFKANSGKLPIIPSLGYVRLLNDKINIGFAILGVAGNKVDYSTEASLLLLENEYSVAKIAVPFSYELNSPIKLFNKLYFGLTPYLNYGSLLINTISSTTGTKTTNSKKSGTGFGFSLGVLAEKEKMRFGISSTSKAKVTYKQVVDLDQFGHLTSAGLDDVDVEQPAELGFGFSYLLSEKIAAGFDLRTINWGSTKGAGELGWQNQMVFGFGGDFKCDRWVFRTGASMAKSAVPAVTGESSYVGSGTDFSTNVNLQGHSLFRQNASAFAVLLFPGVAKTHLTLGSGYAVSETIFINASLVHGLKNTVTRAGSGLALIPPSTLVAANYDYTSTLGITTITLGLDYVF